MSAFHRKLEVVPNGPQEFIKIAKAPEGAQIFACEDCNTKRVFGVGKWCPANQRPYLFCHSCAETDKSRRHIHHRHIFIGCVYGTLIKYPSGVAHCEPEEALA